MSASRRRAPGSSGSWSPTRCRSARVRLQHQGDQHRADPRRLDPQDLHRRFGFGDLRRRDPALLALPAFQCGLPAGLQPFCNPVAPNSGPSGLGQPAPDERRRAGPDRLRRVRHSPSGCPGNRQLFGSRRALVVTVWEPGLPYELAGMQPGAGSMDISPPVVVNLETSQEIDKHFQARADRIAQSGTELARSLGLRAEPLVVADEKANVADAMARRAGPQARCGCRRHRLDGLRAPRTIGGKYLEAPR